VGITSTATYKITRNGTQLQQSISQTSLTGTTVSGVPVAMFAIDVSGVAGTQTYAFVGTTSGTNGDISAVNPEMLFIVTTV
jgi:hypothetical protein